MVDDAVSRIEELQEQERELVLASFDHADAWRLGTLITERSIAAGHRVAIDIRRPGLVLFRAALPGVTADQEEWIRRKSAVAQRFEASSALVAARFATWGVDPAAIGWLEAGSYAVTGGAFPVRVAGAGVVAVITASGLSSDDDHQLAVDGLTAFLAAQRS